MEHQKKELKEFAKKIGHYLENEGKSAYLPKAILSRSTLTSKGIRIPYSLALCYLMKNGLKGIVEEISRSEMRVLTDTLPLHARHAEKNKNWKMRLLLLAWEAHLCCERQDFHLFPFNRLRVEKLLHFRRIALWNFTKVCLVKKQLDKDNLQTNELKTFTNHYIDLAEKPKEPLTPPTSPYASQKNQRDITPISKI